MCTQSVDCLSASICLYLRDSVHRSCNLTNSSHFGVTVLTVISSVELSFPPHSLATVLALSSKLCIDKEVPSYNEIVHSLMLIAALTQLHVIGLFNIFNQLSNFSKNRGMKGGTSKFCEFCRLILVAFCESSSILAMIPTNFSG